MADTYIKISELEETTLADDSSYIPIDNGNHTYKITVENYNSGANATAQSYAEAAAASADDAETAKTAAETAETETGLIRTATQQYATAASGSASAAASSAVDALNYADSAASAAANAADSAQDAAESYTNAAEKAVLSESWAVGGTNTRTGEDTNNSQYYAAVATSAAENAEDQVELANAASTAASGSAVDAAASATEASGYADDASDYATAASGSATAAATSATQSANSAGAAATSATNAAASATAASGSASTATTQANNAAQSATTAGGYATQAASSASDASGYATNAANSATAAAGSATTASNQATAAAGSATAAAASASDAADSAADAAESAATFTTDDTLSIAGKAADAKAAGDMIAAVQAEIPELDNWLTTPGAAAEAKHTGDRITEVEDDVADLKSAFDDITSYAMLWPEWTDYLVDSHNYLSHYTNVNSLLFDVKPGKKYTVKASGNLNRFMIYGVNNLYCTEIYKIPSANVTSEEVYEFQNADYEQILVILYYGTKRNVDYKIWEYDTALPDAFTIKGVTVPTVSEMGAAISAAKEELAADIETCVDTIFYQPDKTLEWVEGLVNNNGYFVATDAAYFDTHPKDKVTKPFALLAGETVIVKTKGDGYYNFNCIAKVNSLNIPVAAGESGGSRVQQITSNNLTEYTHTAAEDEYLVVCVLADSDSEVTFDNIAVHNHIEENTEAVENLNSLFGIVLRNKSVMFFGDSLTSASTSGVNGFAKIMAKNYNMPYYAYLYDSGDGNQSDVPHTEKCFVNYGKDGTTNRIVSGRIDSVLERVKRHIDADANVDYVLIECCVNDSANSLANKGQISDSYTATYDTSTTIGAIEETIRYLTTLEKPLKVGFFIPWNVVWVNPTWFDDYIAVFEKWGVPYYDMRKSAGFNMRSCLSHRLIYSLASGNYQDYNAATTYNLDDKVKYGGILYKCLVNGTTGIAPTNTAYWMEVSSESADGTHLNNIGHSVISGKIQNFVQGL